MTYILIMNLILYYYYYLFKIKSIPTFQWYNTINNSQLNIFIFEKIS